MYITACNKTCTDHVQNENDLSWSFYSIKNIGVKSGIESNWWSGYNKNTGGFCVVHENRQQQKKNMEQVENSVTVSVIIMNR